MLHLRRCIVARLLSSPATSPIFPLHRLLSAAAPAVSPNPGFAAEEYLVHTCSLTRAQALKVSAKISHIKSPTNPDAVLAFLADLGLAGADIAALVGKDPLFLCAGVERTLSPVVVGLTGLGLSRSEVARLVLLAPDRFRCRSIVSKLQYYLPLFGSSEKLLQALKLGDCDVAKLCLLVPWLLSTNLERVQAMVACAEGLGVPRESMMFRHMLQAVSLLSKEKIAAKLESLKNTFRWSDAEVRIAVCKAPKLLTKSKEALQSRSNFLISDVGLAPAYIAHRPAMLTYSLEGRIRPRYYVLKFLKEKGLLHKDRDYYSTLMISEKEFMEKFVCPHKEAAPHLAEDYAAVCRGEVPT
uniref:Uncharacterized protein n=2 Tax=Avena sativa TaxID=4498 RepID=A0ACD5WZM6_AVESA